ncbi:hypothetical protein RRG08_019982 [Elysia crispata]|uniref:Uncharacterized protein n=1 Tax=Elysia crispata TaxID=231223 RepID=A0AAE1BCN0_9GAST|nr:hypothetical protein RRG08_019982 [Elysia crispata]
MLDMRSVEASVGLTAAMASLKPAEDTKTLDVSQSSTSQFALTPPPTSGYLPPPTAQSSGVCHTRITQSRPHVWPRVVPQVITLLGFESPSCPYQATQER